MNKTKFFSGDLNYIKIKDLKDGYLYKIKARNARVGIWKKDQKGFIISREKFGDIFLFMEYHYDTGPPYGTVMPIQEIEKAEVDCNDTESQDSVKILEYLNDKAERLNDV